MLLGYSASGKIVFIKTHDGTCGKVPMKMVEEDGRRWKNVEEDAGRRL